MPVLSFKAENGVGAIATSPSGRDVALASRAGLYIVDLQEPYSPPRLLSLRTPWEVSSVQWCSHPNHYNRVVSTSSQKLVVWNLALPSHNAVEHVLHGHSRAITDVAFSRLSPDLLATCSIDTYVHIWDMRDPLRPSMSFADFEAGASQVKWSKTQPHLIASAHQNRMLLWDSRKQNVPLIEIAAHTRRINSIDFDDTSNNNLATASTDRSIKVWNLNDLKRGGEQTPRLVIEADFPIWRTRYLPDGGNGAFVIPLRGSNNNAFLTDFSPKPDTVPFESVQTFSVHKAPIKDLSIRREGNGYNLLTWGGDSTLCVWNVDESSLNAVDAPATLRPIQPRDYTYRDPPSLEQRQDSHRHRAGFFRMGNGSQKSMGYGNGDHLNWIAGVRVNDTLDKDNMMPYFASDGMPTDSENAQVAQLSTEITSVGAKFPKVHFEQIDIANGKCVLTTRGPWGRDYDDEYVTMRIHVRFPPDYPHAPLECSVEEDPNSDPTKVAEMEQYLSESLTTISKHGKPALEFCLRYIMGDCMPIETIIFEPSYQLDDMDDIYNSTDSEYGLGNTGDLNLNTSNEPEEAEDVDRKPDNQFIGGTSKPKLDSTPLPRTCGAIWANNGSLISFHNIEKERKLETDLYALGRILPGEDESDSESSISSFESESDFEPVKEMNYQFPPRFHVRPWVTAPAVKTASQSDGSESLEGSTLIKITNYNHLLPCRPDIAADYRYDFTINNIAEVTTFNAKVALRYGRLEDAYIWKLTRYHSQQSSFMDQKSLLGMEGNNLLLPFFNLYASKFHTSILDGLVEHLKSTENYMLLVGLDCIHCIIMGREIEQVTRTFYYNGDRPSSFVPYFESNYLLSRPLGARPDALPRLSSRVRRSGEKHPEIVLQKYNLSSVTHTPSACETAENQYYSSLNEPRPTLHSHHSSASTRQPSKATSEVSSITEDSSDSGSLKIRVQYLNPVLNGIDTQKDPEQGFGPQIISGHTASVDEMAQRRKIYAAMLDSWGLSIKRLEILNIPFPDCEFETAMDNEPDDEWMVGIKLVGKRKTRQTATCVYCLQSLSTQFVTCLRCNHVYHRACLQKWSLVSIECASGCGCSCMHRSA